MSKIFQSFLIMQYWVKSHFRNLLGETFGQFLVNQGRKVKIATYRHALSVPFFRIREEMYTFVSQQSNLSDEPIQYLEFGVSKGRSIKWWTEHNNNCESVFYGFDTFEGLPEDWGFIKKGTYTNNGVIPDLKDQRIRFVKGLFHETMDAFLEKEGHLKSQKVLLHLDADIFSSTLFVLLKAKAFLKKGDVIIFDEYFTIEDHESRAFESFLSITWGHFKVKPLAQSYAQLAVEVTESNIEFL